MKADFTLHTNGRGLWSSSARPVRVTALTLNYLDTDDPTRYFGELLVHFAKEDWNTSKSGLIYTDPLWIKELRSALLHLGCTAAEVAAVGYSEMGMQGKDHVSLDCGDAFCRSELCRKLGHPTTVV